MPEQINMRYLPSDETPPDYPGLFKISTVFVFIKVFTKLFAFYFVRNLQIFQANLYKKFQFCFYDDVSKAQIFLLQFPMDFESRNEFVKTVFPSNFAE